jgi:type I restriction enzyme S subunit
MNQELLLAHFDRISDAPNAIPRLRSFVLNLAVRGKLVEQNQSEESASALLERIRTERARLVKEGKAREFNPLVLADGHTIVHKIPKNWKWVPLGETLNKHFGGGTPSKDKMAYWGGDILWASVKDIGKDKYVDQTIDRITEAGLADSSSNLIPPGNLIVVTRMGLGKVSINRVPLAINQDLRALCLSSLTLVDYHYIFFKTHAFVGTGLTVKGIKVGELLNIAFPLPPLAEQHRIVAKVDELMALCDRLEAAKAERENRRDSLSAASHHRLNNGANPEVLRKHAHFYLDHFPRITNRPKEIRQLRQTILNLAVRGHLVRQDPKDEPASFLSTRLEAEARTYAREQNIAPPKPEQIREENLPHRPPNGWIWTRLCSLFKVMTDGDHQPPPKTEEGIAFLTIGNITTGRLDFSNCRFVSESYLESVADYRKPSYGDILYTVVGATYGRPALVNTKRPFCVQRHIAILKPTNEVDTQFVYSLLASPLIYDQATRSTTGAAQPTVPLRPLRNFLVLLPPLAEQHRIVAKVNELMAVCDRLEAQLTTAQTESSRLLEAVLQRALAENPHQQQSYRYPLQVSGL